MRCTHPLARARLGGGRSRSRWTELVGVRGQKEAKGRVPPRSEAITIWDHGSADVLVVASEGNYFAKRLNAPNVVVMTVLVATHDLCRLHDPGPGHPESPDRLGAVLAGVKAADLGSDVQWIEASSAPRSALERVHSARSLDSLAALSNKGGGAIDPDTWVGPQSDAAARKAAGAGLDLITELDKGRADAGWSIVRPPGHHARPDQQMGFCLINNVAVAARHLADRGERVAIVDVDAHHGNGTQDIFYADPDVLFVSLHQYPWYPFTGAPDEVGSGLGRGANVNIPLPAGATGQAYREAFESIVGPVLTRFAPTWILVSAGFDGHRADPITDLGLTSGDYADSVTEILELVEPGKRLLFLEGGYDLTALRDCTASVLSATAGGQHRPEAPTTGGPGVSELAEVQKIHLDGGPGDV